MKGKDKITGTCIKIKNYNYATFETQRSRNTERNPIRIVVDKIGPNGIIQQQVVNQNEVFQKETELMSESKIGLSPRTTKKNASLPNLFARNYASTKQEASRSHVFNRFQYDNYQNIPKQHSTNTVNYRKKRPHSKHKNIETIFCENKFPEFVDKTNQKIEQLYKKQQQVASTETKKFILSQIQKEKIVPRKTMQKTTLANCLKQFGTLEKLSIFMQNDQNLRGKYLHFGIEKDPSRTLLIDVLNHRFSFMKHLNRRLRDNIYRCLLQRDDIHAFSKMSVQDYIRFYQMFIGRDASVVETATFVYLILFGTQPPSLQSGGAVIEQTNGPLHKRRIAVQQLGRMFEESEREDIVNLIANNQKFMRILVDLIIEK